MKNMTGNITLPGGEQVCAIGQGTWFVGDRPEHRKQEIAALRLGVELGLSVIDTAELYGDGRSEMLVGEAISAIREQVFLASKVMPQNASRRGTIAACERSLKRLKTDRLDLYLYHWLDGEHPVEDAVRAFEDLVAAGKIRHWGVSNFDTADMADLTTIAGGTSCITNQILYNPSRRGPEYDLLPWLQEHGMPVMAYSPIEQGRLPANTALDQVALRHDATRYQIALAWTIRSGRVLAIPKATSTPHVLDNHKALNIQLSDEDLALIDADFPPPSRKQMLEML
jgi:diketogulonate reductase-like aldo/keto reductase